MGERRKRPRPWSSSNGNGGSSSSSSVPCFTVTAGEPVTRGTCGSAVGGPEDGTDNNSSSGLVRPLRATAGDEAGRGGGGGGGGESPHPPITAAAGAPAPGDAGAGPGGGGKAGGFRLDGEGDENDHDDDSDDERDCGDDSGDDEDDGNGSDGGVSLADRKKGDAASGGPAAERARNGPSRPGAAPTEEEEEEEEEEEGKGSACNGSILYCVPSSGQPANDYSASADGLRVGARRRRPGGLGRHAEEEGEEEEKEEEEEEEGEKEEEEKEEEKGTFENDGRGRAQRRDGSGEPRDARGDGEEGVCPRVALGRRRRRRRHQHQHQHQQQQTVRVVIHEVRKGRQYGAAAPKAGDRHGTNPGLLSVVEHPTPTTSKSKNPWLSRFEHRMCAGRGGEQKIRVSSIFYPQQYWPSVSFRPNLGRELPSLFLRGVGLSLKGKPEGEEQDYGAVLRGVDRATDWHYIRQFRVPFPLEPLSLKRV